jgi:hypothetical protein
VLRSSYRYDHNQPMEIEPCHPAFLSRGPKTQIASRLVADILDYDGAGGRWQTGLSYGPSQIVAARHTADAKRSRRGSK